MTVDEMIEVLKDQMIKATGVSADRLILISKCHEVAVLKLKSQNEQGYIYVCGLCMEPISAIVCKIGRVN